MTSDLRDQWNLDDDVAFLNHGSFGATPKSVLAAQARLRDQLEREPVRFFERYLPGALDAAREAVATWVNADAAGLAFVPNASTGVATVLANLTLHPGDELLVTDHAYGACRNAFALTAAKAGATLVTTQIEFPGTTAEVIVEAVLRGVTDRTKLVLLDHVTSPTGLVFPVERILPLLAERGIDVLIDAAHGPGMLDVDVANLAALGATYYTANGHKWPCAPKGAALLWVRADRRENFHPQVISHGLTAPLMGTQTRFRAEFDWIGTDDPTAFLTWPTAIEHVGAMLPGGWAAARKRNRDMTLAARDRLCSLLGIAAPAEDGLIGSLAALPLPADRRPELSASALHTRLVDAHRVQVPVFDWGGGRVLRVALHLHTDLEDIEALAQALTAEGFAA